MVNKVTTVTSLYITIDKFLMSKLATRLFKKDEQPRDTLNDKENKCSEYKKALYQESLSLMALDTMVFPESCKDKLKKEADRLGLLYSEVLPAFFLFRSPKITF